MCADEQFHNAKVSKLLDQSQVDFLSSAFANLYEVFENAFRMIKSVFRTKSFRKCLLLQIIEFEEVEIHTLSYKIELHYDIDLLPL